MLQWYFPSIIATTTTNPLSLANSNLIRENQALSSEVSNLENTIRDHAATIAAAAEEERRRTEEANNLREELQQYRAIMNSNSRERQERQQALIVEANRQRLARQQKVEEARENAIISRRDNECTDNQDVIRRQIESQRRLTETQRQLNIAEQERQNRIAELIQQEEAQEQLLADNEVRRNLASTSRVTVNFLDRNDNSQDNLLPVVLEQSDNIDELSNNADVTVNNIFTNHYSKNLTTYMQNKIKINEMKNKIDNLNSNLQKKMNNRITYGTDGEMMFY